MFLSPTSRWTCLPTALVYPLRSVLMVAKPEDVKGWAERDRSIGKPGIQSDSS